MIDLSLIVFLLVISAAAFYRSLQSIRAGSLNFFPTIGWILGMVVPFAFEWWFFETPVKYTQFAGITLFLGLFFSTDWLSANIIKTRKHALQTPGQIERTSLISRRTAYIFIATSIALIATHLSLTQNIPLLESLLNNESRAADIANRYNYYRGFTSFWLLPYILSLNVFLFSIPVLIYLLHKKCWVSSFLFFCICVLYAISGNTKSQFVIIMVQLALVYIYIRPDAQRLLIRFFQLAFAVYLVLCVYNGFVIKNDIAGVPAESAARINVPDNHIGDYYRMSDAFMQREGLMVFRKPDTQLRYYFYRCIITPVEVSARWYQYFDEFPVTKIEFSRQILDSRTHSLTHPSNAVGKWAYVERFPKNFYPVMHAYASIDADSYGRFGIAGWVAAAIVYALMRLGFAVFYHPHSLFRRIFYGSAMAIIGSLAPSSSIQALVLPNALGTILAAMIVLYFIEKRAWEKDITPPTTAL